MTRPSVHTNTEEDKTHEEWGFSTAVHSKSSIPVQLKGLNFPKWFADKKFEPATSILMKMDIEVTALLAQGSLCKIKTTTP